MAMADEKAAKPMFFCFYGIKVGWKIDWCKPGFYDSTLSAL
jgi:hypothetical protein